jgi:tRNA threonylcarbamoyladenosine modification (KEOPS) complex Cgi121 subunit
MKTNAERQQEFRKRQQTAGENGKRKIECYVTTGAELALKRLARHKGISQGAALELLLNAAEEAITSEMTDQEHEAFLATR